MGCIAGRDVRNRELDGIRGLAALYVAVGRCATATGGLPVPGETHSDWPRMTATQLAFRLIHEVFDADAAVVLFFVRRAFRLLPVSILSGLVMGLLLPFAPSRIVGSMFLLDIRPNPVLWTLQVEIVGSVAILDAWALCVELPGIDWGESVARRLARFAARTCGSCRPAEPGPAVR